MVLTLYTDYSSQPCRSVAVFLDINKIKFEAKHVDIMSRANVSPEYALINPFQSVPVIEEDNFTLIESEAILKYIAGKKDTPKHWYPTSPRQRARVDEYMAWHHTGVRAKAVKMMMDSVRTPLLLKTKPDPVLIATDKEELEKELTNLESYFLKDQDYLAGPDITIADILCCEELNTIGFVLYDYTENRPKLAAYMARVRERLNPFYDNYNETIIALVAKLMGKGKADPPKTEAAVNGNANSTTEQEELYDDVGVISEPANEPEVSRSEEEAGEPDRTSVPQAVGPPEPAAVEIPVEDEQEPVAEQRPKSETADDDNRESRMSFASEEGQYDDARDGDEEVRVETDTTQTSSNQEPEPQAETTQAESTPEREPTPEPQVEENIYEEVNELQIMKDKSAASNPETKPAENNTEINGQEKQPESTQYENTEIKAQDDQPESTEYENLDDIKKN